MSKKITIDIVCPYGGYRGGVEDVIKSWIINLNHDLFDLRIMHMTPGAGYVEGFEKAYFLTDKKDYVDANYCASGYNLFLSQLGTPDICIASNEPLTTSACRAVLKHNELNIPLFSWIHSEIARYDRCGNGNVNDILKADYHLAINSHIAQEILEKSPTAKVYTIGNPITHEIPDSAFDTSSRTISFIGRLAMEKRIDVILEAICKSKTKWKLNIIGDGDLKNECHKWVKTLRLEKQVNFLGWQENPLPYLSDSLALVAASDYEGFMVSGIEALAMGKMLISTPTQGAKDYLRDGENGYFFGFEDSDSLAKILDDIASGKKDIPSKEVCQASVQQFSPKAYFNNLEKILLNAYNTYH